MLTTYYLATDWDGSDGEYDGSSEPMDSIAELGDVDAQL
jgi:ubiquitin carboxyl-terminal hydrolase 34